MSVVKSCIEHTLAVVWQVLGQDRLVTMEDRKDLPYIEAVVTEIMRLVPVGNDLCLFSLCFHAVFTLYSVGFHALFTLFSVSVCLSL